MAQKINNKCLECSKHSYKGKNGEPEPKCYKVSICGKKRSYYRNIEHYRFKLRQYHRYLKFLGGKCLVCGSMDKLEAHHIEAQIKGGKDIERNIVTLCYNCHKIITSYHRQIGYERSLKAT